MKPRNPLSILFGAVLVGVLSLLYGCHKENLCDTPFGEATCTIDITSPSFYSLYPVGGFVNIIGGNKGVFVVHTSLNEFAAFERTCPHDHDVALDTVAGSGGTLLRCPVCGSQFSTYADGAPIEGSVTSCSLYQYSTLLEGYSLYIW